MEAAAKKAYKYNEACELLPQPLRTCYNSFCGNDVEEIRLRTGSRPTLLVKGRELPVREMLLTADELNAVLEKLLGASYNSHLNEIKEGYINYRGLRVGVCAHAIFKDGKLSALKCFTSLCIRIPGEFEGDISLISAALVKPCFESTLIISPPGLGKTTLLRKLINILSDKGYRVSVVDERNEIASIFGKEAYFDLGEHTDILTGFNKSVGAMMLLRGMNPQIIAMDEISKTEDIDAIYEIAGCGVEILATAHGRNEKELMQRPLYKKLLNEGIFKNLIIIKPLDNKRNYELTRLCR